MTNQLKELKKLNQVEASPISEPFSSPKMLADQKELISDSSIDEDIKNYRLILDKLFIADYDEDKDVMRLVTENAVKIRRLLSEQLLAWDHVLSLFLKETSATLDKTFKTFLTEKIITARHLLLVLEASALFMSGDFAKETKEYISFLKALINKMSIDYSKLCDFGVIETYEYCYAHLKEIMHKGFFWKELLITMQEVCCELGKFNEALTYNNKFKEQQKEGSPELNEKNVKLFKKIMALKMRSMSYADEYLQELSEQLPEKKQSFAVLTKDDVKEIMALKVDEVLALTGDLKQKKQKRLRVFGKTFFTIDDLKEKLTPEEHKALAIIAKLQMEMYELNVGMHVKGSFYLKFLYHFLAKKKFRANNISVVIELPNNMTVEQLLIKVPLVMQIFKRIPADFDITAKFANFISASDKHTKIYLAIEEPGCLKNNNPFILSQLPLELGVNLITKGSLHFFQNLEPKLEKDIKNGRFPIEIPNLKEKNTVRHFVPRLAKYLIVCEEGHITPTFYYSIRYQDNDSKRIRHDIPPDLVCVEMEKYFNFVFESPSKALIKHHIDGVIRMFEEGNATQLTSKEYILAPFCSAFLLSRIGSEASIDEEIRQAGKNMAAILQRYFEQNQFHLKNLRKVISLFHPDSIPNLARISSGQICEWVDYIRQREHTFSKAFEKFLSSLATSTTRVATTFASSQNFWSQGVAPVDQKTSLPDPSTDSLTRPMNHPQFYPSTSSSVESSLSRIK